MNTILRFLCVAALCVALAPQTFAQNAAASQQNAAELGTATAPVMQDVQAPVPNQVIIRTGDLLYDNGPLANSQGTGTGGDDESILTELETLFGSGAQKGDINNAVFDDFRVPASGWNVSSLRFFAYQSFSTPPTLDEAMVTIYRANSSGMPGTPVGGNCPNNTNYTSLQTTDTGVNRVTAANGGNDRQIQQVTVTLANTCVLAAGTYWVGVQYSGNDAFSGPWQPPVAFPIPSPTCPALRGMGAKQTIATGLTDLSTIATIENGTCQEDIPFQIIGKAGTSPSPIVVNQCASNAMTYPQGSQATFTYKVTNNVQNPASGVSFYEVFRGGNRVVGPVQLAAGTLPGNGGMTPILNFAVNIPGAAPTGNYTVRISAGPNNGTSIGSCNVPIAVQSAARPAGSDTEWTLLSASPTLEAAATTGTAVGAYPNPFVRSTTIGFELDRATDVSLVVYDVRGREVAVLTDGMMEAGQHTVTFDAASLPSGVYVYRLTTGTQVETGRLTLVQ